MAEEPVTVSRQATDANDQDPEHHQHTLTDLIDEIEREAFSRSLSKRGSANYRNRSARIIED